MNELRESLVSDKPPLTSLLIIFLLVFAGFVLIGPIIGFITAMSMYEGDLLQEVQSSSPDPASFLPILVMQGIASLIGLVVLPVLYVRFANQKSLSAFFRKENNLLISIGIVVLLGLTFILSLSPIIEWNMNFQFPDWMKGFGDWAREQEDKLAEMTRFLTHFNSHGEFLLGLLVIAIIPAVGEEFVFRGLIQNELWRSGKNIHVAIWVSALLFSAIHLQFFGFLPRLFLGALFGYMYYWSGNLLIPIIAHFFNNGFSLTMIYLRDLNITDINVEDDIAAPLPLVAVCAVITFALLYFFRKQYRETQ